ncbi:MAG: capsular biosynthesis protein [Bacteroidales bacterium]|nr:capsular biosynthesis protein [Bacteroidales bacterium]
MWWPFSKKYSLSDTGLLDGATDGHSHLLPGVDDGIRQMEDTLSCLHIMEHAGIEHQWLTPHVMEDMPNEEEKLRELFAEVQQVYAADEGGTGRKIELHLGAEYMMDNLFASRMDAGTKLLCTYEEGIVLVETSIVFPPLNLEDTLHRILSLGYRPMLAHPERYQYMRDSDYRDMFRKGIHFQLNLPSLIGAYGDIESSRAEWMLEKGMYYIWGTDTHRVGQLEATLFRHSLSSKVVSLLEHFKG